MNREKELPIIGSTEYVELFGIKKIPAKIDTGADTSSIWASNINMDKEGVLTFSLFDKESPFYTGEKIKTTDYKAKIIRSSNGSEQVRYRVKMKIVLSGVLLETTFTLADRSKNNFPILIGRHTIEKNFLVDVSKASAPRRSNSRISSLNKELENDPYKFHQKYIEKGE